MRRRRNVPEHVATDTVKLGSDHRAVRYLLRIDGLLWTVWTYNMGGKARPGDLVDVVLRAHETTPGRWTLALQETADQVTALRNAVAELQRVGVDVELVQGPRGLGRRKLAAIVPAGTLVGDGLRPLTERRRVGPEGAGGVFTDAKYVQRLRQRSGRTVLRVGNVHYISSVEGRTTPWKVLRRALHRLQVVGTRRWAMRADSAHVATVVVGDYNCTPGSPLLDPWRGALQTVPAKGSHGGRNKDHRAIDLLSVAVV